MKYRSRLFLQPNLYDIAANDAVFLRAMREITAWHLLHNADYAQIARHQGFKLKALRTMDDLGRIPPLPTLFLKRNRLYSLPQSKIIDKSVTSGTSGTKSEVGTDLNSGAHEILAALRAVVHHHLPSLLPANYIILGYQPNRQNKTGLVRTAFLFTLLAPALHREYTLVHKDGDYTLNLDGVMAALLRYERQGFPVRIVGLPAFLHAGLSELKKRGIRMQLNPHSLICLGGGWKQQFEITDKAALYQLAQEVLGIAPNRCHDFYSVVEHPLPYFACAKGHFHVPIFSRALVRDVQTLQPVPNGTPGLLNFISPLMCSMPLHSVMTDDLAILHEGTECGCGNSAPYFELLGRAGLQDVKTCAVGAGAFLETEARQ